MPTKWGTETAAEINARNQRDAKQLPVEVKQKFWHAMTREGKNMGEAREIAGIEDVMVAAALVIQLHDTVHIPKRVEEIV